MNNGTAARAMGWKPPAKEEPARRPVDKFTFGELAAAYPVLSEPVIDGIGRRGETGNIIGDSKSGKSWFLYTMLLSVVSGRDWLDTFPVNQGDALLIDNELPRSVIVSRIRAVAAALGIHPSEYETQLSIWPLRGNLRSMGDLSFEFEDVEPGQFRVIGFDARYRFPMGGASENDNTPTTDQYNQVDAIAVRNDGFNVMIGHSTKGDQADKKITDVGAGAGAQSRAADAHLILRPHEDQAVYVLDGVVRSFAPFDPLAIRWEYPLWRPDEWADPSKLQGRLSGGEQRQQTRDKEGQDAIVHALLLGPLAVNEICSRANMGKGRANRLLAQLEADGNVVKREAIIAHNKATVYMLPDTENEGGL